MSSLLSFYPIKYLSNSSRLMESLYGISVGVSMSSPASKHWSCRSMRVFHVSPQGYYLVRSYRVVKLDSSDPFYISWFILGLGDLCYPNSWAREDLVKYQDQVPSLVPRYIFCFDVWVPRWDPRTRVCLVNLLGRHPCCQILPGVSGGKWHYISRWCRCLLCLWS